MEKQIKKQTQKNTDVANIGVGDISELTIIIAVAVLTVAFVIGALVETRDDFTAASSEYNATQSGITALEKIPAKMGLVVTIFMIVIIITALMLLKNRN